MKPVYLIAAAGVAFLAWRSLAGGGLGLGHVRNDAAGPRLPAMPAMPRMPSMPGMPSMGSGAAPNAPQIGPQAPAGLFSGMW